MNNRTIKALINPVQINGFINDAIGLDNRTLGWGMVFLHESFHTALGGGLVDPTDNTNFTVTGPFVEKTNTIRAELNAQGSNYGQRLSYYSYVLDGADNTSFIPFNHTSVSTMNRGFVPSLSIMSKYISYKRK